MLASDDGDEDQSFGDAEDDFSFQSWVMPSEFTAPKTFEIPEHTLFSGMVRRNTVVELKDDSGRISKNLISGDFLLVRSVLEDLRSGKITLRGLRLRRCAYLQPTFDSEFSLAN